MVLSMNRWIDKVAVVTGAGGGVGGAVVTQLLEQGLQVVAIDNRPKSLEELAQNNKEKLHTFTVDITKDEEVSNLFRWTSAELGSVHILINCAGVVQQTNLTDGDTAKWKKVLDTNVLGLCIMTREAIKIMKENKIDGHVVHVGSIVGHYVSDIPQMNTYAASKYAIRALTETLRQELNHLSLRIKVTCISPGKINTLLPKNNGFEEEEVEAIKKMIGLEASDVADAILYALATPPHVQVHDIIVRPLGESF